MTLSGHAFGHQVPLTRPVAPLLDHTPSFKTSTVNRMSLVFMDVHCLSLICIDFHWFSLIFIGFHCFSLIFDNVVAEQAARVASGKRFWSRLRGRWTPTHHEIWVLSHKTAFQDTLKHIKNYRRWNLHFWRVFFDFSESAWNRSRILVILKDPGAISEDSGAISEDSGAILCTFRKIKKNKTFLFLICFNVSWNTVLCDKNRFHDG